MTEYERFILRSQGRAPFKSEAEARAFRERNAALRAGLASGKVAILSHYRKAKAA